ncbi:phosphonate metabolism transcriptional regulator PhnF [Polycladidibacter stylochi]|uniref:phosphonate metabolism transcriptional regulator PhnF n=1 Tax=Polycladidibacter stylochi TaxID=1807766 RepID=UPI000833BDFC|nr:phosphonate metabolism transcriptional regulator PhnF [Pseudovibrio stylochi]
MTETAEIKLRRIERRSGLAMWRQIADEIRNQLTMMNCSVGTQLPTESVLSEGFQVNRHTVRRAIGSLVEDGFLRADQGRGTYLARKPLVYPIGTRTRYSDNLSKQDIEPSGKLLGIEVEPADMRLCEAFSCPTETPMYRVETLNYGDDVPLIYAQLWFIKSHFPELPRIMSEDTSVTHLLKHYGIEDYTRKKTLVSAMIATPELAEHLQLQEGAPILVMESLNIDGAGNAVQLGLSYVASERMHLTLEN